MIRVNIVNLLILYSISKDKKKKPATATSAFVNNNSKEMNLAHEWNDKFSTTLTKN